MNRLLFWLWPRLPINERLRNALLWLLNPKFSVGVTGLVRDERGWVLLLRHTYRPGAEWGLPGGGLHHNESLEECLRREIREEVGLEVEVGSVLIIRAHKHRRLVDMIVECRPRQGSRLAVFEPNSEIAEARFFPPDALPRNMSRSQRHSILRALQQAGNATRLEYMHDIGERP